MQHLLHFLYEHAFDKQLYFVIPCEQGELQLTWRADAAQCWHVQRAGSEWSDQVPRTQLTDVLHAHGADLRSLERELHSLVAAHVVVADQLLHAARRALGSDGVHDMLEGQEHFVRELRHALTSILPPRLRLVR